MTALPNRRGLHRGHVLGLGVALAGPVAMLAPKGLAPLCAGLAILLAGFCWATGRGLPRPSPWLAAMMAAPVAYGAVSALWAVMPAETLGKTGQLLGLAACGLILLATAGELDARERRTVAVGLVLGWTATVAYAGYELATDLRITRLLRHVPQGPMIDDYMVMTTRALLKTGGTVLVLMSFAAAVAVWRLWSGMLGWLVLAAPFALLAPMGGRTAGWALAIGVVATGLAWWRFRVAAGGLTALVVAGLVAAPVVPRLLPDPTAIIQHMPMLPNSFHARLQIWRFTAGKVGEMPLTGWGLDAARSIPGGKEKVVTSVVIEGRALPILSSEENMPLHPHNAFLQIWLELGLPGAVWFGVLVAWMVRRLPGVMDARGRAAALGLTAAALVIANSSYGATQSWWLAALWLAAAALVAVAPGPDHSEAG